MLRRPFTLRADTCVSIVIELAESNDDVHTISARPQHSSRTNRPCLDLCRVIHATLRNVPQHYARLAEPCLAYCCGSANYWPTPLSCHVLLIYINACVRAESSAELTRGTDQCEQTFRHIITRAVCNVVFQELTQPNRSTKRRLLFLSRLF